MKIKQKDFVWAKVIGHSYWPAVVMKPDLQGPPKPRADMYWIYFFGSCNYAWVPKRYIKSYSEYRKKFLSKCSQKVKEANLELLRNKKLCNQNPQFKIDAAPFTRKESHSRPRSSRSNKSSSSKRGKSRKRKLSEDNKSSSEETFTLWNPGMRVMEEPVGVLAANIYAEAIAKNLIEHGHNIHIWGPNDALFADLRQFAEIQRKRFTVCKTVRDLVKKAVIIFSCLSSNDESRAVLYYLDQDRELSWEGKVYVEMTFINVETSGRIDYYLHKKRAVYVEAMIHGTMKEIEERDVTLLIGARKGIAKEILKTYKSCFCAIGKATCSVGEVGAALKIRSMIQMLKAVFLAGFAEVLALADKCIDLNHFFEIFQMSPLYSPYLERICDVIKTNNYGNIQETLQILQEDLGRVLTMANKARQSSLLTSTASQLYKHARRVGYDDYDAASMYLRARY